MFPQTASGNSNCQTLKQVQNLREKKQTLGYQKTGYGPANADHLKLLN